MKKFFISVSCLFVSTVVSQNTDNNKFRQLYQEYATPNVYRTAGGAPGHQYYQQRADYDISVVLDDEKQTITGEETITYHNNSPDQLEYLWIQLDQNIRERGSMRSLIETGKMDDKMSFGHFRQMHSDFDGGFKITSLSDGAGRKLPYTINHTMMRVDLPKPLASKSTYVLKIKWWYNINNRMELGGRAGYEYFKKDDNYLYAIAKFFPRMCVYNDVEGWQNKQFLGRGEFTLNFGNYKVSITAPADHVLTATGVLQNESAVLTAKQRERLKQAKTADKPIFIVTPEEALKNESSRSKKTKTWIFKADNVRDFAFASSRKFIWDAQGVKLGTTNPMAMSFYPKEGNPLWEKYSTRIVAHTLKNYSKHTFDYPYPVAISVHTDQIGMEYPMICFNGGRPEEDGTYSERTKYGMLGVIIHEVGHNYFPMIVNSDERQWSWMDEGLNTFLQYRTEQEWERGYPSRRGPAPKIVDYMKGDKKYISPIMTNSESIWQFGNNAYGKPATALNILRETIMGRELFDYAFKVYANRWMFKHPTPEDFFRTMEDASGVDLDWFWHGWFYTTDCVDISLDGVKYFRLDSQNPEIEKPKRKQERETEDKNISELRNRTEIKQTENEKDPSLNDFYVTYDPLNVTEEDKKRYEKYLGSLTDEERALLNSNYNYYELSFSNMGGLVMPLILEFAFEDGTTEVKRIPAEVWRVNNFEVSKIFWFEKQVTGIRLDPFLETADVDVSNNMWPRKSVPSRFQLYKQSNTLPNPMQKAGVGKQGG